MKHIPIKLLHAIFPPLCIGCNSLVSYYNTLCSDCFKLLQSPAYVCKICSVDLELDLESNVCASCINNNYHFNRLEYCFKYSELASKLLVQFKHYKRFECNSLFTNWLNQKLQIVAKEEDIDIIIPIPISYRSLLNRSYNHSALIAKQLSKRSNLYYNPMILYKKHVLKQSRLSLSKRKTNLKKAFYIPVKKQALINNKTILLLDDVITTGNTIHYASKVLKKHGAKKVIVIALFKVAGTLKIK